MPKSKKPSGKAFEFTVPQEAIEQQLEAWVHGVLESSDELMNALRRICDSYRALLAGKLVIDGDEILAQVEAAMEQAAKAKDVV